MTIHHHLSDATLLAYAAGSQAPSLDFVTATHLSLCRSCRQRLQLLEPLGGALLDNIEPLPLSGDALSRVMAQLDHAENKPDASTNHRVAASTAELPAPLNEYLPDGLDEVKWKTMAPGIKSHTIQGVVAGRGSLRLLKIAPGITIPEHSHQGGELTLVLRGSFADEVGRFKAGDIADLDAQVSHQPIADTHEDCICLIATEAPLRFKAMMPKIMQYFIGM